VPLVAGDRQVQAAGVRRIVHGGVERPPAGYAERDRPAASAAANRARVDDVEAEAEKLPVRRTEVTPQSVLATYASTRVPPGCWRPSPANTSPANSVRGATAPPGLALERRRLRVRRDDEANAACRG
jgi:hypothetical protein